MTFLKMFSAQNNLQGTEIFGLCPILGLAELQRGYPSRLLDKFCHIEDFTLACCQPNRVIKTAIKSINCCLSPWSLDTIPS